MRFAWSSLLLFAACVTASPEEDESQVTHAIGCQAWGCGTNSPMVGDGLLFDELDASGTSPNRGGLRIVAAALHDGTPVTVAATRHVLVAYGAGKQRYTGAQLQGAVIRLRHAKTGDYELLIERVDLQTLRFWAGAADVVPSYDIKSRKVGETVFKERVCKTDVLTLDPDWAGVEHHAIVFQGDRYDPVTKQVWEVPASDPWFNVACAGTTPAKLHLMRHTRAGSYLASGAIAYDTTRDQRQAMLKMFTADYCGTGQSFTEDAVRLVYDDANHWYREREPYRAREALWSADGALCLDDVRLSTKYTVDDVYAACGRVLPACPSFTGWESYAHVMSALPTLP